MSACNLSSNSATSTVGLGGAIYNSGTLTINNSTLDKNSDYYQTFDNTDGGDGGAIYNQPTSAAEQGNRHRVGPEV